MKELEEMKELVENMEKFFGYELPSPINFPITFIWDLLIYKDYSKEIG